MKMVSVVFATALVGALSATGANATIATSFGSRDGGAASFDATVTGAGGTVNTLVIGSFVSDTTVDFGPISVSRNNGGTVNNSGIYDLGVASTSGNTIDISPNGTFPNSNGDINGGVTFTFDNPVNSFGFEVGDWGTCCQPSRLFISFDGGAPILVGTSLTDGDVFLTNGEPIVFVGAFDDSNTFSNVQFWGDGSGEYLLIGGTLRYATLDKGSLPAVPEPASWAMMIAGFGAVGSAMRRRRGKTMVSFA